MSFEDPTGWITTDHCPRAVSQVATSDLDH